MNRIEQIESYISTKAGIDLSKLFDQYLRTTNIPLLKYKVNGKSVAFNYERVVKGFAMPIRVTINGKEIKLTPSEVKQTVEFSEDIKYLRSFATSTLRQRKPASSSILRRDRAVRGAHDSIKLGA